MEKKEFIKKNNDFFTKWARIYNIIEFFIRNLRKKIAEYIPNRKQVEILDVCTGTGSLALRFAKKNHNVIGLDLSEAMLSKARRLNKFPNLKFIKGDATNMPFNDSTKDICSISFGFHDMPHNIRIEVFMEMVRVIKPKGYIFIIDYNQPRNKLLKILYYKLTSLYESEFYPSWYYGNYYNKLLENFSFRVIQNKTFMMDFARLIIIQKK